MITVKSNTGKIRISSVEEEVFQKRCFPDCLKFEECRDVCCSWGCDVARDEAEKLLAIKGELEPLLKVPAERWFKKKWTKDADFPSGEFVRSRVRKGKCVFYAHELRGCMIHRYAVQKGIDPHTIKPMVCFLFPATWEYGKLMVAGFLSELPCSDKGITVYDSQKKEIEYYFGKVLAAELEELKDKF